LDDLVYIFVCVYSRDIKRKDMSKPYCLTLQLHGSKPNKKTILLCSNFGKVVNVVKCSKLWQCWESCTWSEITLLKAFYSCTLDSKNLASTILRSPKQSSHQNSSFKK